MSIEAESSRGDVDSYLKDKYGYDLTYFEYSLRNISTFYNLIELKKKVSYYLDRIRVLETEKQLVIERLDDFLSNANLWDEIKQSTLEGATLTQARKIAYIKSNFGLNSHFDRIDEKLKLHRKRVTLLNGFQIETEEKKKRLMPQTLISLVWYLAVQFGDGTKTQKFQDISILINWFALNEIEDFMNLFDQPIEVDASAVKNDYERYIQKPTENRKIYKDLAFSLYGESFSDIEE